MITLSQISAIKLTQIINDVKSGIPIVVNHQGQNWLSLAVENISENEFNLFKSNATDTKLIISKDRAKYLGVETIDNVQIDKSSLDFNEIHKLVGIDNLKFNLLSYNIEITQEFNAILNLLINAEIIPAIILFKPQDSRICYNFNHFEEYITTESQSHAFNGFQIVSKAWLNLKIIDKKVELIAFRDNFGLKEHYAIIVGHLGKTPVVRLHSSCYTGDLLSSLSCDCHDQFHKALNLMASNEEGGILIYLIQEGRGIGLVNKLRAYNLQAQGLDTMDANLALGFPDDARVLWPASKMLELLGISKIKLLTNNPSKIAEFKNYGIDVTEIVKHHVELNNISQKYMDTKIEKMGHIE
ncbi:GTP cyclohydrolase II [Rickettsiales endosymbiont of Stachyamoeba lipophora]|uniref:GTP cyclohydrolase II n=1 Tax=Rickettsiales endosymbiont of Stachyamoeba lipophora TaxID=2486578 RepID=UPI000F65430D|nr:GTP cyclohydrolase II [Rickettsiales endosymbiont of Stachyamoeba lipophora]AZL14993.1 GTP cyclohydrolase II [Rickettsiales endosymbiont of Stachyamoeba lipophora]